MTHQPAEATVQICSAPSTKQRDQSQSHPAVSQVVPAQYAFVVHTANPLTGERGELFGEAVVGMGEALVGNFPGRALSFTAPSGAGGQVSALPSASVLQRFGPGHRPALNINHQSI